MITILVLLTALRGPIERNLPVVEKQPADERQD